MGSERGPEDHSVVPQLAADCDMGSLPLSPAEGFLLSRVDGQTPWSLLRESGALPAEEVDRCLREWAEQGVVVLGPKPEAPPVRPESPSVPGLDAEDGIDPGLDLSVELQREVIDFERRLDRPYTEILGVAEDADSRVLRRAYFKLSKDFHPDRYFRKNLGPYAARIERVFCKIAEAFEILSDPSARAEMEKSLSAEPSPAAPAGPRLRGRTTPHAFSLVARIQRERRRRAKGYFEAGQKASVAEEWVEAAHQLRLAIASDPGNAEYKESFGDANRRANEIRAERYLKEADSRYELGEYEEAYKRYVDALHCRPFDAVANHRAAKLAWRIQHDLKAAKEYASSACEVEPENAEYRKTLGHIYNAAELHLNAQREFETALRLDPRDEEAKQELKNARKLARRSPRGGS